MTKVTLKESTFELPKLEAKYVDFKGFRGESLLKKPEVKIEWTPELIAEYAKCAKDPKYFIETYIKIINVDKGLIPFKLRSYQVQLIDNLHEYRRNIITFGRQSGKSTAVIGYLLWYILFNEHKTAMLLANKGQTAREILGKAHLAYFYLPQWLQAGVEVWNKGSIVLENGSRAIAESTSSDSIRGYSASLLIIDEAAYINHADHFFQSTLPVITSGETTKLVLISTPNGLNHYYKTWEGAQHWNKDPDELPEGVQWNGYVPLLVTWKDVPGRDQKWYNETIAEMDFNHDRFSQEYDCQFLGSSGTLVSGWKLRELAAKLPLLKEEGLSKYEVPRPKNRYVLTADVSEGKGLDYSTFHVIDVSQVPYRQVCVFRSNETLPHELAQIVYQIATIYNNALVLIEYANLGPIVSGILFDDFEYENILATEGSKEHGRTLWTGSKSIAQAEMGLRVTPTVKRTGCAIMKMLIEQNQLEIVDHDTIQELSRFSRCNNSYRAEEGFHDDLVSALIVFSWLTNQTYFKHYTDINTMAKVREQTQKEMEDHLSSIGFMIKSDPGIIERARDQINSDKVLHNLFKEINKKPGFDDDDSVDPIVF